MSAAEPGADAVVAIAMFGRTERDQHLIDDDAWYFRFLRDETRSLDYWAGVHSAARLRASGAPDDSARVHELPARAGRYAYEFSVARSVRVPRGARVIFFGYSETLLIFMLLLNLFRREPWTLVNTNNISAGRLARRGWFQRAVLRAARHRIARFVVHTQFEKRLVEQYLPFLSPVVTVKKHHLMIPETPPEKPARADGRARLHCFGPLSVDKTVDGIAALLAADNGQRFETHFYRITPEAVEAHLPGASTRGDIFFHPDFLDKASFRAAFGSADLVFMTHGAGYEGKLSGVLCDCIALDVPFVGQRLEPLIEYESRFGRLGFLYTPGDPDWPARLLSAWDAGELRKAEGLALARAAFGAEAIAADYREQVLP